MFLGELLKVSRIIETEPSGNDIVIIPAGINLGVDYTMVVSREDFERILVAYRAVEPASEAILMAIGTAKGVEDPVWETILQNESIALYYGKLCNEFHAAKLKALERSSPRVLYTAHEPEVHKEEESPKVRAEEVKHEEKLIPAEESSPKDEDKTDIDVSSEEELTSSSSDKLECPNEVTSPATETPNISDEEDKSEGVTDTEPAEDLKPEPPDANMSDGDVVEISPTATIDDYNFADSTEEVAHRVDIKDTVDSLFGDSSEFKPLGFENTPDKKETSNMTEKNVNEALSEAMENTPVSEDDKMLEIENPLGADLPQEAPQEETPSVSKEEAMQKVKDICSEMVTLFKTYGIDNVCSQIGITFIDFVKSVTESSPSIGVYIFNIGGLNNINPSVEIIEKISTLVEQDCGKVFDNGDIDGIDRVMAPIIHLLYEE